MIVDRGFDRSVRIRYREDGERKTATIKSHYPYLFVKDEDVIDASSVLDTVVLSTEEGYRGVYGE